LFDKFHNDDKKLVTNGGIKIQQRDLKEAGLPDIIKAATKVKAGGRTRTYAEPIVQEKLKGVTDPAYLKELRNIAIGRSKPSKRSNIFLLIQTRMNELGISG